MGVNIKVTGGNRFMAVLNRIAKETAGPSVRVGVLEGATDMNGEPVAPRAFYNEFGTEDIPARPAIRLTLAEKQKDWANGFASTVKGKTTAAGIVEKALGLVGEVAAGHIREKIGSGVGPALAPATIARKIKLGKAAPALQLVEDGDYQRSIASEFVPGGTK
jgi:hypothetical protein